MKRIIPSTFEAIPAQTERLQERRVAKSKEVLCCGLNITVLPGVYQTSIDTELMAESVHITPDETFLEIGCGTGTISIILAKQAKQGLGVDINPQAVKNSQLNAKRYRAGNVQFLESDVFENVKGIFDVVVCNPPYSNHLTSDVIDKMFWDEGNRMKERFFKEVRKFLAPNGRLYFGWADFADIDVELPFRLAEENDFKLTNTFSRPSPRKNFTFYVLEFQRKRPG